MKNIAATIFQTFFSNHPVFTILMVFTIIISLLFLTVFIPMKSGSITMSIDFKKHKIKLHISKQKT